MITPRLASMTAILALSAVACKGGGTMAAIPADSTAYYRAQSENIALISAEKDSLIRDLTETTRLITDVSVELATIRSTPATNAPVVGTEGMKVDDRAEVLAKVRQLTARIRQSESRLATTRRRLDSLATSSDSLRSALAVYASTVVALEGMLADQKTTIQTLTDQIGTLTRQNVQLAGEKAVLEDTVTVMDVRENEVYYVIGTKKELMSRGIISEEGGTRFLVFTRTGETLVPAAVLDPAQFTKADRRTLTELAMPKANKDYRVISHHDMAYAETDRMNKGRFRGAMRITAPTAFWAPSKFLIIVEH